MPTLCSMCGGTYGKCESCKRSDMVARNHENPAAGAALIHTLESFKKPNTTATEPTSDAKPDDPQPPIWP